MRTPSAPYLDPLDRVWLAAAARVGLRVRRTEDAYASTDGDGELAIATREHLDQDDSLAQMIFHELCHSLVEGRDAMALPDWGLDNETDRDVPREHACLRAQAALAAPVGLRWFFAPTTDYRAFYDTLGDDPLAPADDPTSRLARTALARAGQKPWAPALGEALVATAAIVRTAAGVPGHDGSLFDSVDAPWPAHPAGFTVPPYATGTCGDCAWRYVGGRGKAVPRCRRNDARVDDDWPACEGFEGPHDCLTCGACCRAAYDSVELSTREPLIELRPDLIVRHDSYIELRRDGDRCAALAKTEPLVCAVYEHRPKTCRDFELGGAHCLTARQRVGLSR